MGDREKEYCVSRIKPMVDEIRLEAIEKKLDKLIVTVEHRLTSVETAQSILRWVLAPLIALFGILLGWIWKGT